MYDDLKFDLCCGARSLYRAGLSVGIAGHLSIMVGENTMIANRFGPSFATLKPEDILTLDLDGNILDGRGFVNDTIRLHGVIHKVNPEIVAVAHTHPPATITFSSLRAVPEVFDQESCFLAGEVAVVEEDYSGLASTEDRVRPMGEALKTNSAIILPNHGAITRGANIREAVIRMLLLEGMVQRHLSVIAASRVTGITPRPIAPEIALATKRELNTILAGMSPLNLVWDDLVAKLRASDPDLFAEQAASAAS
ncbi:MAG TPA: class II aldolase/adducin family protein [Blastocatellia bacterium]|nr:class II aldolase/adducin family protein [Blastocatellia bacterium]